MSEVSSAESAASTLDLPELGFDTSSSVRSILGDEQSSGDIGPESRSTRTYETWLIRPRHVESEVDGTHDRGLGVVQSDVMHALDERSDTLIFSAAASPARTSQSPADEPDSQANVPDSSSSSPESLSLFAPAGFSSRTFPDFFHPTVAEISPSYSRRWPSSGMAWPGECWTLDSSESPSDAVECSLSDILEPEVPPRFFLSLRAARGILRRAEKRGRQLPSHLSAALEAVAQMTTTGKGEGS